MDKNSFNFFMANNKFPESKSDALVAVADTMWMGKMWFQDNGLSANADQLLKFAELVLKYEHGQIRLALITDDEY